MPRVLLNGFCCRARRRAQRLWREQQLNVAKPNSQSNSLNRLTNDHDERREPENGPGHGGRPYHVH